MTLVSTVEDGLRDPRVRGAQLHGRIVTVDMLEAAEIDRMFELLALHFDGVERPTFESDLTGKTSAILLEDVDGTLRGFSTLHVDRRAPGPARPSSTPATRSSNAAGGAARLCRAAGFAPSAASHRPNRATKSTGSS